jgi:hypothetical protein
MSSQSQPPHAMLIVKMFETVFSNLNERFF